MDFCSTITQQYLQNPACQREGCLTPRATIVPALRRGVTYRNHIASACVTSLNGDFRFAYRAPEISWEDAKAAHALCTHHREALKNADRCGCFYCKRIYDPKEIKDWVDGGKTALCPYCGIDSVIPDTEEYPLTTAFLKKMYHVWFT
mgnify:CR=1 FL=1